MSIETEAGRALTATVVIVGSRERLDEGTSALAQLAGPVRTITISPGTVAAPPVRTSGAVTAIEGLRPEYVNNAVASLRLSSLPTIVWWRGGDPALLGGLAALADRLLLDADEPADAWRHALSLVDRTALGDLRWTRLTRWRALMAHFFDMSEVQAAAPSLRRLEIDAPDPHAARLFAAWLVAHLPDTRLDVTIRPSAAGCPLERVRLGDGERDLALTLSPSRTCVAASIRAGREAVADRTTSLGAQDLAALLAEELRVRSRDYAFERALAALAEV